jgi:hypothetical protein
MVGDLIHVRTIEIDVAAERDGRREARGRICDRRHQGHTYTGSHVIGPGIVHDMSACLTIDTGKGTIVSASSDMKRAAFDGSPETRFESCRDILPNVEQIAGARLDGDLAGAIRRTIGRERGCYHLTNLWLAIASLASRIGAASIDPAARLRRSLELTACEGESGRVCFTGHLTDVGQGAPRQARLGFEIDPRHYLLEGVNAAAAPDLRPLPAAAVALEGVSLTAGFARAAVERLGGLPAATEILDLALGLNAVVTQGMLLAETPAVATAHQPSTHEPIPREPTTRAAGTCYMWRSGGPVERLPTGKLDGTGRPGR